MDILKNAAWPAELLIIMELHPYHLIQNNLRMVTYHQILLVIINSKIIIEYVLFWKPMHENKSYSFIYGIFFVPIHVKEYISIKKKKKKKKKKNVTKV